MILLRALAIFARASAVAEAGDIDNRLDALIVEHIRARYSQTGPLVE